MSGWVIFCNPNDHPATSAHAPPPRSSTRRRRRHFWAPIYRLSAAVAVQPASSQFANKEKGKQFAKLIVLSESRRRRRRRRRRLPFVCLQIAPGGSPRGIFFSPLRIWWLIEWEIVKTAFFSGNIPLLQSEFGANIGEFFVGLFFIFFLILAPSLPCGRAQVCQQKVITQLTVGKL